MRVQVIGSGIAGLSSALRLACAGYEVEVFEANAYPGGKLTQFKLGEYRFDAGPSLFTLPQLVLDLVKLAGKNPETHFPYIQLEQSCNYFYEDGTRFSAWSDPNKFALEVEEKLKVPKEQVLKYLNDAAFKYKITAPLFVENTLHRLSAYSLKETLSGILAMPKLDLFDTMDEVNQDFFSSPHLQQYFNRFATYNGSDPYQAPGLLTLIPHLEHGLGSYFPKQGMHQITETIYQLALEKGVSFHFNSRVDKIRVENNRVKGLEVNGQFYPSDLVVSNSDIHPLYRRLLRTEKQPEKLLAQEKSSSALIFYWGIRKSFPELLMHNIFFSSNYRKEFDTIFKKKSIDEDPTIYINITSKHKADDAPDGCENWFVMVNAGHNTGEQNWDELIASTRKNILSKLSRILQTDIEPLIEVEDYLDPRRIEARTSSYGGSLYGNASNNRFAAFLRHKNFSSSIKGLYLCGGSVHPGGGIPLCLNSGKIVSELIQEDFSLS